MQHIPAVSHAQGGRFSLKMLDVVITIQTTGSYHRQDFYFIYSGEKAFTDLGAEQWIEGCSLRLAYNGWISTEG